MASFVEVLVMAGALASPGVPAELEARVGAAIAERWGVDPATVRLDWSAPPAVALDGGALFRIAGAGVDGRFAVVIGPGTPDTEVLRVRAGVDDSVVVAARALGAGTRLSDSDLAVELRTRWGPPRAPAGRPAAGWEVRRALGAGEPLESPAVLAPALVTGGEPVRLIWARGDVTVSMSGVALNSARLGEPVRARVDGRRTVRVQAVAVAPGVARLSDGGAR